MLLLKIISCVTVIVTINCIVEAAEDISFKDVVIEWRSDAEKNSIKVASSTSLKENVPEGVRYITVSGSVPVLHKNAIANLNNLSTLNLDRVGLEEIKPGAFKHFQTNLLSLTGNKIEDIHSGVFEDVSVNVLHLYNTGLRRIEPGTFVNVHGVRTLELSSNKLEEINPDAFSNPTIDSLSLEFNSISSLRPGDLKNLPKLKSLDLSGNKLKEIPEGVFNDLTIQQLKLGHNEISKIASKAFNDMVNLSVVHFDNNKLSKWDNNWLYNCPKLAYVIAGFNEIEEIPAEAFKNYPKIFSIDLQHNKIKRFLPNAMATSRSIVNFNLDDNEIDYWNDDVLGNVTISTVYLKNNKIKCIDGDLKKVFKTVYAGVVLNGNPWDPDCPTKSDYVLSPGPPPKPEDQFYIQSVKT